jgi:hypothetical protein
MPKSNLSPTAPAAKKNKFHLAKFICRFKSVVIHNSQCKPYSEYSTLKNTTSKRLTVNYEPMNT